MKHRRPMIAFMACALLYVESAFSACISTAAPTAPATRFFAVSNTVSDVLTGLTWTRCSIGQQFVRERCIGEPTSFSSMAEALNAITKINDASLYGHRDFRLPNFKELLSIVEYRCHSPAIDILIFPDTPPGAYLSSTPNILLSEALFLDFRFGTQITESFNTERFVRLVRER